MRVFIEALKNEDEKTLRSALKTCERFRTQDKEILVDPSDMLQALKPFMPAESTTESHYESLNIIFFPPKHYLKLNLSDDHIVSMVMEEQHASSQRYRMDFAYDGTAYLGFQRQSKTSNTIQKTIESVLDHFASDPVLIQASGRTDKGVHALSQTAHFDADIKLEPARLVSLMNEMLPNDILIKDLHTVPPVFHARFDVLQKTYQYRICHIKDPFEHHHTHYTKPLEISMLKKILEPLIGTHDFQSFSKYDAEKNTVRTIKNIKINQEKTTTYIEITADGFLRYMMRIIIGNALNDYFYGTQLVKQALDTPDKNAIKHVAPANGLYLKQIAY